nr:H457 [uncultured bacterium]
MAKGIDVVYTFYIPFFPEPDMSKEAVFTMKLEPELRDAFMAEAEASHRPASQIVRELMREFVERQRQAREYDALLRAKVDTARGQIASGQVVSDADVEARFAARRAALRAKTGAADA